MGETSLLCYLKDIEKDLILTADQPNTRNALRDFSAAWQQLEAKGGDMSAQMQKICITDNPHPSGQKDKLDKAGTGTDDDAFHAKYHPWFHKLQQEKGYYDIFLFDPKGNLVYTVFKELDYATNFATGGGKWSDTDLDEVFRQAMQIKGHSEIAFEDFKPYKPSADAPASFMAHPIFDGSGKALGVIAFQVPNEEINKQMCQNRGLGKSGEVTLIGQDGLMRNDTAFTPDKNI